MKERPSPGLGPIRMKGTLGRLLFLCLLPGSLFGGCLPAAAGTTAPAEAVLAYAGGEQTLLPAPPPPGLPETWSLEGGSYFPLPDGREEDLVLTLSLPAPGGTFGVHTPSRGWVFPGGEDPGLTGTIAFLILSAGDGGGVFFYFPPGGLPPTAPESPPRIELRREAPRALVSGESRIEGLRFSRDPGGAWEVSFDTRGDFFSPPLLHREISLFYGYAGGTEPGRAVVTDASGEERAFDLFPKTGAGRRLVFLQSPGESPAARIRLEAGEALVLWGAELREHRPSPGNETPVPLRADTGTILHYPRSLWRHRDFEIFRWNHPGEGPAILFLVSANYGVQSRFLKRLAFFVEKEGFAGTLASDAQIQNLSDWNAHDYRAEDLARFFQLAQEQNFPLNGDEERLRRILLENGVLSRPGGDAILPGEGALIGVSLETFYEQRYIFMIHEAIHGLYFTQPELRETFRGFYLSLTAEEKLFWENFLSYRGYNTARDEDLLINETGTYLLQQPPDQAVDYFLGFITPRLLSARPHLRRPLMPWLLENYRSFEERCEEMQEKLKEETGLRAENFHDLLPVDRPRRPIFEGMAGEWLRLVSAH